MKTLKTLIILLIMTNGLLHTAAQERKENNDYVERQNYTETISGLSEDCTLEIKSPYGLINIESGDTPGQITIDMSITIEGRYWFVKEKSEKDYSKMLKIKNKRPDKVTITNKMPEENQSFTTRRGHNYTGTFSLYYEYEGNRVTPVITIRIPKEMNVIAEQKFGTISMPDDNMGNIDISLEHANMEGGNFKNLTVKSQYADHITVENIETATFDAEYSHIETGDIDSLSAVLKYSNCHFGNVNKMNIKSEHGHETFKNADKSDIINIATKEEE